MTTTAIDVASIELSKKEMAIDAAVLYFFERWQPEDRRESAQFHMEFYSLIRQIYAAAGEPAMKHLTQVLNCMPIVFPMGDKKP